MDQDAMDNSDKRMKKCSKYKTVLTTLIRGARAEGWAKHRARPQDMSRDYPNFMLMPCGHSIVLLHIAAMFEKTLNPMEG